MKIGINYMKLYENYMKLYGNDIYYFDGNKDI